MVNGAPQRRFVRGASRNGVTLLVTIVSMVVFVLFCRMIVVFTESYSVVTSERRSDETLLELCSAGQAIESARMRSACMGAKADQASPIIFKVLSRTVYIVIHDAYNVLVAPFNAVSLAGGMLMIGMLPWFLTMRSWLWPSSSGRSMSMERDRQHTVLIMPGRDQTNFSGNATRRIQSLPHSSLNQDECERGSMIDEYLDIPGLGWNDVALGHCKDD
jgi:hypothetical protein